MNKQFLFKTALFVWLGSIPFMLVMGYIADWLQRTLQPMDTSAQIQLAMNTPTPPVIIAARLATALAGLYIFFGWIPVVVLGLMKGSAPKKQS